MLNHMHAQAFPVLDKFLDRAFLKNFEIFHTVERMVNLLSIDYFDLLGERLPQKSMSACC